MKILQINLNRCRVAHDLLYHTAKEKEIDLCLVSEPNENITKEWGGHRDAKVWIVSGDLYVGRAGSGLGHSWIETRGMNIISCYMTPNQTEEELEEILESISETIRGSREKDILIGGDFNAKSPMWGSLRTDSRGAIVTEWIAQENLTVLNWGGIPTFRRRDQESQIDLTLCTGALGSKINWQVLEEEETGSDHQYIEIEIREGRDGDRDTRGEKHRMEYQNFSEREIYREY